MRVLTITGDKTFGPGHQRYELQRGAVDELAVAYWGRGRLWPLLNISKFRTIDIVTVQDPFWRGLFGWIAARRIGAKFNVQVHADLGAQNFARRALARFVLRRADSIRVVSERIRKQVELLGVRAPIRVLPVYVGISKFRTIVRQPHEGKLILWIGRFEEEKNPLLALDIIQQIPDAKLVMLGSGGLWPKLRTIVSRLNLDARVEFPGWRDPAPYYAKADVVLCTSRHESFGASVIEALAAGAPVVAPDVGIAKEAGAVVVPRGKLADAIVEILRSGARGELKLQLPSAREWARQWREAL